MENMETIEIKLPLAIISACEENVMDALMSNPEYWLDVEEHLNHTEEDFYEEPEMSSSDYDLYYFEEYNNYRYSLMLENFEIVEDAINQHALKRNNRKFINNNKFKNKIRDKKILFKKGQRFILNAAWDRRGRKDSVDSSILSMDLIKTTQVEGYKEILLYRQPFLCSFPSFNRYNQSRSTRVVFEAYRPVNMYSRTEKLVLVDYYDRNTFYSIDSKYDVLQKYPHLNFYEKSYTNAELPKELQVSKIDFYFNAKISFFGKVVVDGRFCHNQYLYNRQGGSWYYHDKLRIKDQFDHFQCLKDINEGLLEFEDKSMLDYIEEAEQFYIVDQYFDEYEKYPYIVDAHVEPKLWWNEKLTSMYKDHPNIHFQETYDYDFDIEYEMSFFDDFDEEDPYEGRFEDDLFEYDYE
jgi:hypothetical protein